MSSSSSSLRLAKILQHLESSIIDQPPIVTALPVSSQEKAPAPSIEELYEKFSSMVGKQVGVSRWVKLSQKELDIFSDLTNDHNYIHKSDAKKNGSPFGAPIAHGLLTLSMLPTMAYEIMGKNHEIFGLPYLKSGINYGYNNVRFIDPVFVDSEIRTRFVMKSASIAKGKKKLKGIRYVKDLVVETKNPNTGKISDALLCEWVSMIVYR